MKLDRLQLRIDKSLKKWFKRYSQSRGGMSQQVQSFVEDLKKQEEEDGREDQERARD